MDEMMTTEMTMDEQVTDVTYEPEAVTTEVMEVDESTSSPVKLILGLVVGAAAIAGLAYKNKDTINEMRKNRLEKKLAKLKSKLPQEEVNVNNMEVVCEAEVVDNSDDSDTDE